MSPMAKGREEHERASVSGLRTHRKRSAAAPVDPNESFTRAFADALRDILHTEHRSHV